MSVSLSTNSIQIDFDGDPSRLSVCMTQPVHHCFAKNSEHEIIIRPAAAVSDPMILNADFYERSGEDITHLTFSDQEKKCHADLQIDREQELIHFQLQAHASEPIWMVEWKLSGLSCEEMIIPALGGQFISSAMAEETELTYKYPFWLNAQFVIGMDSGKGFLLHSRDVQPHFKIIRIGRENNRFTLTFGFEASAPLQSLSLMGDWYLTGFNGSWKDGVDIYKAWMEKAFALVRLAHKQTFPEWAQNINFILEIWGGRKGSRRVMHTFDQMIERLSEFSRMHSPHKTLLYLPGFANHGVDSQAPDYTPSEQMGGPKKFKALIKEAHRYGFKVMAHTNVLAMTYGHPLYDKFKSMQVIDAFGRYLSWGLDIDGDWLAEPYFAYINPGYPEWTACMKSVMAELIQEYDVDAIFLDQTLLAFNVSRGPNFITGMRRHIEELQAAFPKVLFAGEGIHEHVLNALPMAQIHGIDSIAEVHGMEGQVNWRQAHPVSAYLFRDYVRLTAHLLTKHPSHRLFSFQEQTYAMLDVVPALCLYHFKQSMQLPQISAMIKRADELVKRSFNIVSK